MLKKRDVIEIQWRYVMNFSRTPDRDFRIFYQFYLTYPYQPVGKIKKRIAARRPHACCMSIRDVIVMLTLSHHIASWRALDFLKVFFMVFQYTMRYSLVSKKINSLFV